MALNADTLLERIKLRQQLSRWRTLAILAVLLLAVAFINRDRDVIDMEKGGDRIARVTIEGVLTDDIKRDELFEKIRKDKKIKAVLVRIDSPGGTAIAGEEIHLQLRAIAAKKPVVVLMRTVCASAGYMSAIAGDYVLAREGTLTGSIGVLMQTAEFTDMARKLGITPITIKSGENKAVPSPFEKFDPEQQEVSLEVIRGFYAYFSNLVKSRRELKGDEKEIFDGRVFTGRQALERGLIDGLGGEKEALAWLEKEKAIDTKLPIRDMKPKRERESLFGKMEEMSKLKIFQYLSQRLDGILAVWQPESI